MLTQPRNSTAKESNVTSEIESTMKETDQSLHGQLTCPHARHISYHMSQLRYQFTGGDIPLQ